MINSAMNCCVTKSEDYREISVIPIFQIFACYSLSLFSVQKNSVLVLAHNWYRFMPAKMKMRPYET